MNITIRSAINVPEADGVTVKRFMPMRELRSYSRLVMNTPALSLNVVFRQSAPWADSLA